MTVQLFVFIILGAVVIVVATRAMVYAHRQEQWRRREWAKQRDILARTNKIYDDIDEMWRRYDESASPPV